jgi:hypothetical protein
MPLSDAEKDHIREIEALKDEIRRALDPKSAESRASKFFAHPAVLVVLGFLLTGIAGSWLTSYWKSREAANQRSYLAEQRALNEKYALINSVFKEVGSTLAAADDVLAAYYSKNLSDTEISERMANWHKTSREWRVASEVLKPKMAVNFSNPKLLETFQTIIDNRRQIGNFVLNLPRPKTGASVSEDTLDKLNAATSLIKESLPLLEECGRLMTAETTLGAASRQP